MWAPAVFNDCYTQSLSVYLTLSYWEIALFTHLIYTTMWTQEERCLNSWVFKSASKSHLRQRWACWKYNRGTCLIATALVQEISDTSSRYIWPWMGTKTQLLCHIPQQTGILWGSRLHPSCQSPATGSSGGQEAALGFRFTLSGLSFIKKKNPMVV